MLKPLIMIAILLTACTPSEQAKVKTVEVDLCKARATFRALEEVDSSLAPADGSPRAKIEKAEDTLCASLPQ